MSCFFIAASQVYFVSPLSPFLTSPKAYLLIMSSISRGAEVSAIVPPGLITSPLPPGSILINLSPIKPAVLIDALHGCEVLVLNQERLSPEQEMVQDLMTIVHCFSSRLYGLRYSQSFYPPDFEPEHFNRAARSQS
jgi:hypothetical protein